MSVDPESTFHLIERARQGDTSALERLFDRHLAPLQRFARGRLPRWARDLSDTDDLVQDTLLRTFTRMESFEPRGVGALQAYLRQAVMNRMRDEIRRRGRQPAVTDLDGVDLPSEDSPLEDAIGREAAETYERALERLRPEERRIGVQLRPAGGSAGQAHAGCGAQSRSARTSPAGGGNETWHRMTGRLLE